MGIDLEALANDLRAAGVDCRVFDGAILFGGGYEYYYRSPDVWSLETDLFTPASLDIIARHLGAGQPVAADRAALVEVIAPENRVLSDDDVAALKALAGFVFERMGAYPEWRAAVRVLERLGV